MPLKISNLQSSGQVGVLNRYLDQLENKVNTLHTAVSRNSAIATAASAASGTTAASGIKTVVSNYTIQATDDKILVNSSGPVTITLTAIASQKAQTWRIKNVSTGLITLTPANGFSVENLAFVTLPLQMQSFDIVYDGASNFWIF